MKRLILVALAALLMAPAAPAEAAKPRSKAARTKIVCFAKTVRTEGGRKARKMVCRPRRTSRTVTRRAVPAPQAPAPSPDLGKALGPSPHVAEQPGLLPDVASRPGPVPDAPACVPEDSEWLTVTALDVDARFVLRLSRTCLRAGRTIVQYRNQDAQQHDLWVEGAAPSLARRQVVAPVGPESLEQVETTLTAGQWRLFCSIPGHATMSRAVTVVP